jgi:hypothetical protein
MAIEADPKIVLAIKIFFDRLVKAEIAGQDAI